MTAVDSSTQGLAKIARLPSGETIETVTADVTTWKPDRQWIGAAATFLRRPPAQRLPLYALLRRVVRPSGTVVAFSRRGRRIRGAGTS